jgi:hypothetical protein
LFLNRVPRAELIALAVILVLLLPIRPVLARATVFLA